LHTNSASQTINRVMDLFPVEQQERVRGQFAFVVEGILCQQLLPRMDGRGRVMALELLMPTPAVRNLIREGKIHQIYSQMQMGQGRSGMQTLNQSLLRLVKERLITKEEALLRAGDLEELQNMMAQAGL